MAAGFPEVRGTRGRYQKEPHSLMTPVGSADFHVFSEPPSRDHFWRVRRPIYPQKFDFVHTFAFPGLPKSTLGMTFSAKKASALHTGTVFGVVLALAWARIGTKNAPRRYYYRFGIVFDGFGDDLWDDPTKCRK